MAGLVLRRRVDVTATTMVMHGRRRWELAISSDVLKVVVDEGVVCRSCFKEEDADEPSGL